MNNDREVKIIGDELKGKKIALLITGGIAAYKSPSLVRHFRQYMADVTVYLTKEAEKFVTKDALEWNSINPIVTELSSNSEHLYNFDAYVVAPATYNSINKFANGIADNAASTAFAPALGRMEKGLASILVAPAMHGDMLNSIYAESLEKIKSKGAKIISPIYQNGKAEMAQTHSIVVETIRELSKSPLKGKNILITAGPTPGWIDDVRKITNKFKGTSGLMIADQAYLMGANVKLIIGSSGLSIPKYLDSEIINSYDEYYSKVMGSLESQKFDIGIFSAAVADYIPKEKVFGKIPSKGSLNCIELKETKKVINEARENHPGFYMVTFKYEEGKSEEELLSIAKKRAEKYQLVVANRGEEMDSKSHHSIIVNNEGILARTSTKKETAKTLLELIGDDF